VTGCASRGEAPQTGSVLEVGQRVRENPVPRESYTPPIQLVFDVTTGLYRLVSYPGYYFDGEHFYRRIGARWQVAPRLDGPWTFSEAAGLPSGLAKENDEPGSPPSVPASPAAPDPEH
jgi:hypothetical protein